MGVLTETKKTPRFYGDPGYRRRLLAVVRVGVRLRRPLIIIGEKQMLVSVLLGIAVFGLLILVN